MSKTKEILEEYETTKDEIIDEFKIELTNGSIQVKTITEIETSEKGDQKKKVTEIITEEIKYDENKIAEKIETKITTLEDEKVPFEP